MKRLVFWQLFVAALLLTGNSHAQSIKDLFNKENIEKAVNAVILTIEHFPGNNILIMSNFSIIRKAVLREEHRLRTIYR